MGLDTRSSTACAHCGLVGKVRSGRKYCNRECMTAAFTGKPVTPRQGRLQAQNRFSARECERCGAEGVRLERHHIDRDPTNNADENVEVLCVTCHKAEHAEERRGPMSVCKVCHVEFYATHHRKRARVCPNAECRRSAATRLAA